VGVRRVRTAAEIDELKTFLYNGPLNTNCSTGCTVTNCNCNESGNYWSASTLSIGATSVWAAGVGSSFEGPKTTDLFVRAVRGGSQ
jgi:hypothetical protein